MLLLGTSLGRRTCVGSRPWRRCSQQFPACGAGVGDPFVCRSFSLTHRGNPSSHQSPCSLGWHRYRAKPVASSSGGWGAGVVEPWDVRVLLKYRWVAQHLVPLGQQLCHKLIMGCWPEEATTRICSRCTHASSETRKRPTVVQPLLPQS